MIWPTDAPSSDEIEASLFGPGRGESCVVHLGSGEWIIVDSCRDQRTGTIPALDYLTGIGVDVAEQVRLVVGTHAHGDHNAGLGEVYEACISAFFVLLQAMSTPEYVELIIADPGLSPVSGAHREYRRVLEEVSRRHRGGSTTLRRLAIEGRYLLERRAGDAADVRVLSPSDEAVIRAQRAIEAARPVLGRSKKPAHFDLNESSIALRVESEDVRLLLGGDVLTGPARCGWSGVLDAFAPELRASYLKVPHHGSRNADHEGVWTQLMGPAPVACLTPFRGGRQPRPSTEDVSRLLGRTGAAYVTAGTQTPSPSARAREDIADLRQLAVDVRDTCGQVRARHRASTGRWDVSTYGPARRLVS